MWDVSITYVQEDEEDIVIPLANALKKTGLTVGYNEFVFTPVRSPLKTIEDITGKATCCLVILSPHFFERSWSQDELEALSRKTEGSKMLLLPVWHHVTSEQVKEFSPSLADETAISTSEGLKTLTQRILNIFSEHKREQHEFAFETILLDACGQVVQHEQHIVRQHVEDLGNGIVLEMVSVPGGSFLMGTSETEEKQRKDETPQHVVTVAPFFMGKFLVTQEQWERVMGTNPSAFKDSELIDSPTDEATHDFSDDSQVYKELEELFASAEPFKGSKLPVEMISWHDATEFCQKLSESTGRTYRLPCEAEWEYACRAGTTTPFYFGESIITEFANYNGKYPYDSAPAGIFREKTTVVGSFPPNKFGLYDMHGNIREWCADPWHKDYNYAPAKAIIWEEGGNASLRVLRGGAWNFNCLSCRSAGRNWRFPVFGSANIGLRVVYSVE